MSFDFSSLIKNRSQADLEALEDLLSTPLTIWTAGQIAAFNAAMMKGAYNTSDLNRVTACVNYIAETFEAYGYSANVETILIEHTDGSVSDVWETGDTPTQSQMTQYLANVRSLKEVITTAQYSVDLPQDVALLTYVGANNIEQILSEINTLILQMLAAMCRSNAFTFWSGYIPIPCAASNKGRTWAELDSMSTTWANWQVATWYLLLYGNLESEGVVS